MPKLSELLDQANTFVAATHEAAVRHEDAAMRMRNELAELRAAHKAALEMNKRRCDSVKARWALRGALREEKKAIGVELGRLGSVKKTFRYVDLEPKKRVLLERLRIAATPISEIVGSVSGIYFLFQGTELMYVGRAVNVARRVLEHSTDKGKVFDRASFIPTPSASLAISERRFLDVYRPPLNNDPATSAMKRRLPQETNAPQWRAS
jgi:hypothetical protein